MGNPVYSHNNFNSNLGRVIKGPFLPNYFQIWPVFEEIPVNTVKILLQAGRFFRIITFHGDGGGPLLEATSERKVKLQFIGKGAILIFVCLFGA